MNKSESPIPEELLSAFLDGELAEDERQRVELALAKSDELKTMLAELEQIRTEIQQLPRHTLSGDFATKVVQAAQTQAANNNTDEQPKPTVTTDSGINSRTSRFRWVAGIAATAAAILVALWAIDTGHDFGNVAMNEQNDTRTPARALTLKAPLDQTSEALSLEYDDHSLADAPPNGMGGLGGGMGGGARGRYVEMQPPADDVEFGNEPIVSSDAVTQLDVLPEELVELQARNESLERRMENTRQMSFDAVVFTSISGNKLPTLLAQQKTLRSQNFGSAERSLSKSNRNSAALYSLQPSTSEAWKKQIGKPVPDDSMLVYIEGTRAEIESSFATLKVPIENVQLLAQNTDANALGVPPVRSLAEAVSPIRSNSFQPGEAQAPQGSSATATIAQSPAAVPTPAADVPMASPAIKPAQVAESKGARAKSAFSFQAPSQDLKADLARARVPKVKAEESIVQNSYGIGIDEQAPKAELDGAADSEATQTFRILLIVQPK